MKQTKPLSQRGKSDLWRRCCLLWDLITEQQRSLVVLAMEGMAEPNENESPDNDADTPEE